MGVSVPSQIPSWDLNSGPPDQKSGVQPLEPEKHAQLAEASYNTQSSGTPLLHYYYYYYYFYHFNNAILYWFNLKYHFTQTKS